MHKQGSHRGGGDSECMLQSGIGERVQCKCGIPWEASCQLSSREAGISDDGDDKCGQDGEGFARLEQRDDESVS